jgi:hypothetical protein
LIQQHLDVGCICPSNSAHASLAFIILKTDVTVLPHWVNNYRALNVNTVTYSNLLPWVNNDMSSDAVWSGNNHTNTNIKLAAGNYNDLKVT